MEKKTQFRINTIQELEKVYNHFKKDWSRHSFEDEKKDFIEKIDFRFVTKKEYGGMYLFSKIERFTEVAPPFEIIGYPVWFSEFNKNKKLELKKIINKLEQYNNWRKDNDNKYTMPEPEQVGVTIDAAIIELNKLLIPFNMTNKQKRYFNTEKNNLKT